MDANGRGAKYQRDEYWIVYLYQMMTRKYRKNAISLNFLRSDISFSCLLNEKFSPLSYAFSDLTHRSAHCFLVNSSQSNKIGVIDEEL